MSSNFQTVSHGKWILAGEHAVLRGHPALVFPLKHYTLQLTFQMSDTPLQLTHAGLQYAQMENLITQVIHEGLKLTGHDAKKLQGQLHIHNTVPLGVGLGASAALCVALARWFKAYAASSIEIFDFAKKLEDIFHGQSSGLDIAGAASPHAGIYFKQGCSSEIHMNWQPQWYLSASGEIGITSQCIRKVQNLWLENPTFAEKIDLQMAGSVMQAKQALADQSFTHLVSAVQQANDCFQQWGLITPALQKQCQRLQEAGAAAVKPTGSGGGGHLISLWDSPPPENLEIPLLALS